MSQYLSYFFSNGGQFVTLASTLGVWGGLMVLGALVGGRQRFVEGEVIFGFGAVTLAFTVFGVVVTVPFTIIAGGLLTVGVGGAVVLYRRDGRLFTPGILRPIVIATPLLLMTSAMMASQWDEFSHWLPTVRFLIETDGYPWSGQPTTGGAFPGYPYGWSLLNYLASRLSGQYVENTGGVLNVLLLISFGLAAARLLLMGAGAEETASRSWGLAGAMVFAGTLLNPAFSQKVALTAYADVSTAVCVGFAGILGWLMVDALATDDREKARSLAWQFGVAAMVLINVKQANLVLVVILLGGVGLVSLRDPAVRLLDLIALLPRMILPAVVIYGLWRYHVITELPPRAEAVLLPFDNWHFDLMPDILSRMLLVASKKGPYFILMTIIVGFAIKALILPGGKLGRLAIIIGMTFLGYNAFLFFIFVAQFGEFDALRVASYWRYNMHLGFLAVTFAAFVLGLAWRHYLSERIRPRPLAWLVVILVLGAQIGLAKKIRFDLEWPKPHYRHVASELAGGVLPTGSKMFILDPLGTGESGLIARFDLGKRASEYVGYMAAFNAFSAENVRNALARLDPTHVLVHSVSAELVKALDAQLPDDASHLLEKATNGGWQIVHSWSYLGRT